MMRSHLAIAYNQTLFVRDPFVSHKILCKLQEGEKGILHQGDIYELSESSK